MDGRGHSLDLQPPFIWGFTCPSCSYDKQAFVDQVEQHFSQSGTKLVDGYAPFCKHVFVPNFVGAKTGALQVRSAAHHGKSASPQLGEHHQNPESP
jgi:hypothetical protein